MLVTGGVRRQFGQVIAPSFLPTYLPTLQAWLDASAPNSVEQDGAAHFTSASLQSLSCADNATLQMGSQPFTVISWCNPDSLSSGSALAAKWDGSNNEFILWFNSGGFIFDVTTVNGNQAISCSNYGAPQTSTWQMVAGTYDGANIGISVNAGTANTVAQTGAVVTTTAKFYLGAAGGGFYYNGSQDSVIIIKGIALTQAEIAWFYNGGKGRTSADLPNAPAAVLPYITSTTCSFFNLNEESGTRFDAVGSNNLTASNVNLIDPNTKNGGFESDTGGTIASPWNVITAGTSAVTDTTTPANVYAGSHAAQFAIDASGSAAYIYQTAINTGDLYQISCEAKSSSGTGSITIGDTNGGNSTFALTGSFAAYSFTWKAKSNQAAVGSFGGNASLTFYTDNVTVTDLGPVGISGIAAGLATDGNFCGSFNGTNQYFTVASNSSLQTGNIDYTLEAWFYVNAIGPGSQTIVSKYNSTGNEREYLLRVLSDGTVQWLVSPDGTAVFVAVSAAITAAGWYQVIVDRVAATNTISISIDNGTPVQTPGVTNSFTSTSPFEIGGWGGTAVELLNGRIDNVRFWKKSLSSSERTTLFNNGKGLKSNELSGSLLTSLISAYDMDKKLGITADSIGTNTLTNNNAVTYGQGVNYYGGAVSKWVDQSGNGNNAIQTTEANRPVIYTNVLNGKPVILFNGVNNYLTAALSSTQPYTVFMVANATGGTNNQYMLDGAALNTGVIHALSGNEIEMYAGALLNTPATIANYNAIIAEFNGASSIIGVNGTTVTGNAGAVNTTGMTIGIGGDKSSFPLPGGIAEIAVYGSALTASQINQLFTYARNKYGLY